MRVIVTEEEVCEYSEESEESYGPWEEHYFYHIAGVRVAREDEKTLYGEEGYLVQDDAKEVYVIHMIYSSGDSFGTATGRGIILGAFGDRKVAEAALAKIEEQQESFTIEIADDFGRTVKLHNPGAGYFGDVTDIALTEWTRTSKQHFTRRGS